MFDIYIYKAIKKQKLTSQNELARLLNISTAHMARLKTNKNLPTEETVLKVAALAGIAPEKALIDLNIWRSKDNPERLLAWTKIKSAIYTLCDKLLKKITSYRFVNTLLTHNIY